MKEIEIVTAICCCGVCPAQCIVVFESGGYNMGKRFTLDFALIQAIYWMLYSVAGSFVSVILLSRGYTNASIGTLIAAGSVMAIFLQTILSHITDRSACFNGIRMIKLMLLLLTAAVVAVLLVGQKSAALTIAYAGVIILHTAMHPFVNALSFTLEETGYPVSFGVGRSMGSLAAGAISFVLGYLVVWFSPDVVLYIALVNLVLMAVVIFATDRNYQRGMAEPVSSAKASPAPGEQHEEEETIGMREFMRRNKMFTVMSLGVIALFFGNVILENFMIQVVEGIGGDTTNMGVVMFLLCIFEMPAMIGFHKLNQRFSYVVLLRVSAAFFTVKLFIMYLVPSMTVFYLVQLCQIPGYGLFFPAMVNFIDHIMGRGEALRGQAVFTVALTLGNIIGSIAGGVILDQYSSHTLLLAGSMVSVIGSVLIIALIHRVDNFAGKRVQ